MKKFQSLTDFRIVLDLDSTLVHSSDSITLLENLRVYSDPNNIALRDKVYQFNLIDASEGPNNKIQMWGVFRPHLREFIDFMAIYFKEIYIYSAGLYKYVHSVTDCIFNNSSTYPVLVYSRDDCTKLQGDLIKPLTKIYNSSEATGANETNTLVLDDRDITYCLNPHNGIKIPIYEPNPTKSDIMKDDVNLLQLMYWLSLPHVMACKDVRKLDKSQIFTTPLNNYYTMMDTRFASTYNEILNKYKNDDLGSLVKV